MCFGGWEDSTLVAKGTTSAKHLIVLSATVQHSLLIALHRDVIVRNSIDCMQKSCVEEISCC